MVRRIFSSNLEYVQELNASLCPAVFIFLGFLSLPTWLSGWLGPLSQRMAHCWFVSAFGWWAVCLSGCQFVRLDRYLCLLLMLSSWKTLSHAHTQTSTHSCLFFYLVSITLVGQPTLKKPFDFDHASIFVLHWGLWFRGVFSPLWCTLVTLSYLTAVLPFTSSKKQWHKLPSTAQNAVLHQCSLYHCTPQTIKQFTFSEKKVAANFKRWMVVVFHCASCSCIFIDYKAWMKTCSTKQLTGA